MIEDNEVSIIVQGSVSVTDKTGALISLDVCKSIRKNFPNAEVILSTWLGENTEKLESFVDIIVKSIDPGGYKRKGVYLNVNRQIISSNAGVNKSTRRYCIKVRSDIIFTSNDILKCYKKNKGILITNLTSCNPKKSKQVFSLCDWVYMGTRDEIKSLFNIPLYPISYFNYLHGNKLTQKYNAEQWITINYLQTIVDNFPELADGYQFDEYLYSMHKTILRDSFQLEYLNKLGLKSLKYRIYFFALDRMYTKKEWNNDIHGTKYYIDVKRVLYNMITNKILRGIFNFVRNK